MSTIPKAKEEQITETMEENGEPTEIISLDIGEEGEEAAELDEETTLELLEDSLEENYSEEISRHTKDKEVQESLTARQSLDSGWVKLDNQLERHHTKSPELSAGDIDAAWEDANVGEETVGGMAPTPDQDVVDKLGEAAGISYEDDEPLQTGDKLAERDRERWELDPESAEENK